MASLTVPTYPDSLTEFRTLCSRRDTAAYQLVGCVQVAMAYLNLDDARKAQNVLQGALLDYQVADEAINKFYARNREEAARGNTAA